MKTAVECLEEAFYNTEMSFNEIIALAKQMEKEQIIKAFIDGVDMVVDGKVFITGEEYYNNEIFKK